MTSEDIHLRNFDNKERSDSKIFHNLNEAKISNCPWWVTKWLKSIEYFSDDTRVTQGKNLALKGKVFDLSIESGKVEAKVQGNKIKPYSVRLEFALFTENFWQVILEELSLKAEYQAKILIGDIPHIIEELCQRENRSLFPMLKNDLKAGCNCPDWAIPCKHIAAVYYLLADVIKGDPMILFKIRGKAKNEIMEIINQKRFNNTNQTFSVYDRTLKEKLNSDISIADFWSLKDKQINLQIDYQFNSIDISKLLTESPFMLSNVNLSILIEKSYETAKSLVENNR
ncbi:MAG: SWIM zinc finger family protein [Candidatus Heimdallarchaeota archaeon]|nr:SWIM zinc finger family protein [Candidatus Heimdallarchaeota archaeon]